MSTKQVEMLTTVCVIYRETSFSTFEDVTLRILAFERAEFLTEVLPIGLLLRRVSHLEVKTLINRPRQLGTLGWASNP